MEVFNTLMKMAQGDSRASGALFGVLPSLSALSSFRKVTLALVTRLIVIQWKSTTPPTHTYWIRDMSLVLKLEKIRL